MPIPTPRGQEKESNFISRCMEEIGSEYTDKDQALAVCYSTWRDSKNLTSEQRVVRKMNQINLYPSKEELIEPNPCQEGYEAYGTKIKNGREVPNCVPIQ